jgi:hypothetical protein
MRRISFFSSQMRLLAVLNKQQPTRQGKAKNSAPKDFPVSTTEPGSIYCGI